MIAAPPAPDEAGRLRSLMALQILDTPPDDVLTGLARIASEVLGCPISLVSLIDSHRQWFKAKVGLDAESTPREYAFCAHAILGDGLFEVSDATLDPRFADNPLVTGEPHVRFYAGVPIDIDGHRIGTLCVIDRHRRTLDDSQRRVLVDLGRAVAHWMESWRQQKALQDSEAYRRSMFEQLGDGVMLVDERHRIVDANPHAEVMLGYSRDELLARTTSDLVAPFERHRLASARAGAGDRDRLVEWELLRKDGTFLPAEVNVRRLDGSRSLAVVRDITNRRARDQKLRQLRMAVEQCPESIVITGLDSIIEFANEATVALSGYAQHELIGRPLRMLGSSETADATFAQMAAELEAGRTWKGLLPNRRSDGSAYVQFAVVSPLRGVDGCTTNFVAVMEDVTEKQRMGNELDRYRHNLEGLVAERTSELAVAKQLAENASRAKSDFLATMSHEIRTPMNGVIGIVDVLRQSSLTPYQSELSDTIRESAVALLGIIDDILDFSKIEAGRLALESESVALLRLVEGACDALQPVAAARNVALEVFVSPRLPDYVHTDAVRFRQILNNLVGNAIKFSGGRDRPGVVRVRVEPDLHGRLRVEVGDNGIGMTAEVRARIFQPFVQADDSTTRRFGGTGLGLSICRQLVELFGGSIDVRSTPGDGATFTVSLPLHADWNRTILAVQQLQDVDCHVLLDDPRRAEDWCAYLAAAGARVTNCADHHELGARLADAGVTDRPTVLLVQAQAGDPLLDALANAGPHGTLPIVQIGRGQRRLPRVAAPGRVSMDADSLHRETLVQAVVLALGRAEPGLHQSAGASFGPQSSPSADDAAANGRLVLVAEDNDINRKVVRHQLALLGVAADIANDGVAALERWRTGRYALLLTDLHMPRMDGYELASTIRSEEAPGVRMPIVALTANALRGELDRCRSVGMDAYLSKPVRLEQLGSTLAQWLPPLVASPSTAGDDRDETAAGPRPAALPIFDGAVLKQLIGDDPVLLREVQQEFLASARAAADELKAAVASVDWKTAGAVGHRLKSSARAVGALALGECCERLERAGGSADGVGVVAEVAAFETALSRVLACIALEPEAPAAMISVIPTATGILIVEDESFQLELLKRQLALLGSARVDACQSGQRALDWLRVRETSAVLVLLDLNMPGMDGVEFMRHLANRGYHGAIALISGADPRVLETATKLAAAYQLNVLGHLQKPVLLNELRDLLGRWSQFVPARALSASKNYKAEEIRDAIEDGCLQLHYQPKVSLQTRAVVGVEALVRWNHPVDGLLYPASFVAVAEANGLIDELTRSVLSLALRQARRWHDAGLQLRVAVNVSMDNLTRFDFVEFLLRELAAHGLQPRDLILEITESRLMRDARVPMDILTRLRLKQIGLSIDDFGTGHSSLAQLRDIPFDELKIDRSFVHGGGDHPTERAIFTASLEMAHQLGMIAVAEGVENQADWDFAAAAGCDVAQGYFIARPMPADALTGWMDEWKRSVATL